MTTLEFSPAELRILAMALRIAARQAQTDASGPYLFETERGGPSSASNVQGNPRIQESFADDARGYAELADKIEAARAKGASS